MVLAKFCSLAIFGIAFILFGAWLFIFELMGVHEDNPDWPTIIFAGAYCIFLGISCCLPVIFCLDHARSDWNFAPLCCLIQVVVIAILLIVLGVLRHENGDDSATYILLEIGGSILLGMCCCYGSYTIYNGDCEDLLEFPDLRTQQERIQDKLEDLLDKHR